MLVNPAVSVAFLVAQIFSWHFWNERLAKGWPRTLLACFYLAVNALAVSVLINFYWTIEPPPSDPVVWRYFFKPVLLWEMVHFYWVLALAVIFFVSLPFKIRNRHKAKGLPSLFKNKTTRARLLCLRGLLLFIMMALAAWGYSQLLEPPLLYRLKISPNNLPPELNGFTIAVCSDIHYGQGTNQSELNSIFDYIGALNPDIVILPGDLVDKNPDFALDYQAAISRVKARYGVFAVLGNHDLRTKDAPRLVHNLRFAGIHVLTDSRTTVPGMPITLIGFTDSGQRGVRATNTQKRFNFDTLSGPPTNPENLTILINHRPEAISEAENNRVDLYLAGHTHGGQIAAPWDPQLNLTSLLFGYTYSSGLYNVGDMLVFVSRGVSTIIPVRLWTHPEITLLTLTR
ncbi:MAG: metallophosphoesterase [Deltaproteobacteria bacterium]|jgi:predicted MPP superfamily phosphohydrolase|nr:metallophosphoesterase [Deltaproteobacteria bacterium]